MGVLEKAKLEKENRRAEGGRGLVEKELPFSLISGSKLISSRM